MEKKSKGGKGLGQLLRAAFTHIPHSASVDAVSRGAAHPAQPLLLHSRHKRTADAHKEEVSRV